MSWSQTLVRICPNLKEKAMIIYLHGCKSKRTVFAGRIAAAMTLGSGAWNRLTSNGVERRFAKYHDAVEVFCAESTQYLESNLIAFYKIVIHRSAQYNTVMYQLLTVYEFHQCQDMEASTTASHGSVLSFSSSFLQSKYIPRLLHITPIHSQRTNLGPTECQFRISTPRRTSSE